MVILNNISLICEQQSLVRKESTRALRRSVNTKIENQLITEHSICNYSKIFNTGGNTLLRDDNEMHDEEKDAVPLQKDQVLEKPS